MTTDVQRPVKKKRTQVSQSDFPRLSIQKTLRIIQGIQDQYAGQPTAPHYVALALKMVPTSGSWRNLTGTSAAYGLSVGGYAAKVIEISPLGKRIVAPTEEGDDKRALREAVLHPIVMKQFFEKYNHNKFPDQNIALNVLVGMGLPQERAKEALSILIENGVYCGILSETQSGYFVALDEPAPTKISSANIPSNNPITSDTKTGDQSLPIDRGKRGMSFGNGLYVNFEIHIAADTPVETVEAIFKNMRTYLLENGN